MSGLTVADVHRQARERAPRWLPAGVLTLIAATVAAGLLIRWRTRIALGTPLPPFLMSWSPHLRWSAAVGAAVALGGAAATPWAIARVRPGAAFAVLIYVFTLILGLAVNAARRGTAGWSHVFDLSGHGSFEAGREYLPALGQLRHGVDQYVRHYADLLPYLPTHAKGNPPGPLVAMHLLSITTAGRLTAVCVLGGAFVAPLTYLLGRTLGGDRRGRVAAVLAAYSPAVVIYGTTSVDYVFAAMGASVACLLVARRPGLRALGCAGAGLAAFFSWVLLAIPVWAALVTLLRDGRGRAARLAVGALAGLVAVTLLLHAVWGYDPIAILRAAGRAYGSGAAAHRPYAFWLLGSPAAWAVMLGVPIVWLVLLSLPRGEPAAVALAVIVVVSAVAGFTKAETERIWLPYVPLACVAAAALPILRLRAVLLAMGLQAVVVEILFGTVW
jgi:hypothetical protein